MLARVSQGCKAYRVGTQPPPMVISLACTNKMSARGTMRANKQKSQMVISPTCTKQNVCRRYHEGKTHTHGLHHMVTRGVYKSSNILIIKRVIILKRPCLSPSFRHSNISHYDLSFHISCKGCSCSNLLKGD